MADFGFDGLIRVDLVPTIVNLGAPTVSELTAGTRLDRRLTPDGLRTGAETADIDTSKLSSTSNSAVIGRDTFTVGVKYVRGDDAEALEVEEALVRGATGYLVVRRDLAADTAYAAAQTVEAYPIQVKRPNPDNPAANALQAVDVPMTITRQPKGYGDAATVAA